MAVSRPVRLSTRKTTPLGKPGSDPGTARISEGLTPPAAAWARFSGVCRATSRRTSAALSTTRAPSARDLIRPPQQDGVVVVGVGSAVVIGGLLGAGDEDGLSPAERPVERASRASRGQSHARGAVTLIQVAPLGVHERHTGGH